MLVVLRFTKETCWCVWWPQGLGAPVAPPVSLAVARGNVASILACVQVWSNFNCSFSSCFQRTDHHHCLPLAPIAVSMCSYCVSNPRSFCKIHCNSLSCAVLPCLVHWLIILTTFANSNCKCAAAMSIFISYNCVLFSYSQGLAESGGIASLVISKGRQRGRS